jgi:hypothetical protein
LCVVLVVVDIIAFAKTIRESCNEEENLKSIHSHLLYFIIMPFAKRKKIKFDLLDKLIVLEQQ